MEPVGSYDQWVGRDAYDSNKERIGEIADIYYDDVTGRPEWVSVHAGLFSGERLVPIANAQTLLADGADEGLMLAYDRDRIDSAPKVADPDGHLTAEQERELYAHYDFNWEGRKDNDYGYGKTWDKDRVDKGYKHEFGAIGDVGTERGTVEAEATIHNQEANVVDRPETVRLRKIQRTEMVPVTKEEVVVERDDAQRGVRRDRT